MLTERQKFMLAVFAAAGDNVQFSPVQVQKIFFLLDRNIAVDIGGAQFNFEPYDYGPFDRAVYQELGHLGQSGLVQIDQGATPGARRYTLTPEGARVGAANLEHFAGHSRDYMAKVANWVRSLSFAQLVGSIYNAYPEMKENSIFRD